MLKWLWLSVVAVIVDQASKIWADNTLVLYQPVEVFQTIWNSGLNFVLAYNEGAAYSFMADMGGMQHYFFSGLALIVSAYLIFSLWKMPKSDLQLGIAYALVLGGAVGNLIDRLLYQHVVDFINVYINNIHLFGYFNIADACISAGAILLILEAFNVRIIKSKTQSAEPSASN